MSSITDSVNTGKIGVIPKGKRIELTIVYQSLTSGVDGHFSDGGSRHVVIEELSDLHQHQRVHVMRNVKVPVYDGTYQSGARQRVTTARHSRSRYC